MKYSTFSFLLVEKVIYATSGSKKKPLNDKLLIIMYGNPEREGKENPDVLLLHYIYTQTLTVG
jgi:hypothetical protein